MALTELQFYKEKIEEGLSNYLPSISSLPNILHEAMRYSVCGGGKRVRGILTLLASQVVDGPWSDALPAACAVEMVHSYSLIHDDLPCMDNDVLRRGQPTVHVRFGEATAMLAGDALQPLAFAELAQMPVAPALVVQAVQVLGRVAGSLGMVGGQAIDLASVNQTLTLDQLQFMHRLKTGALIEGSVLLGAIVTGATSETRRALETYGSAIGLAFQIVDDILDVTVDTEGLGKTAGKDAEENKPTYVSIMGLEESRDFARKLYEVAIEAIKPLGDSAVRLKELADFIIHRSY